MRVSCFARCSHIVTAKKSHFRFLTTTYRSRIYTTAKSERATFNRTVRSPVTRTCFSKFLCLPNFPLTMSSSDSSFSSSFSSALGASAGAASATGAATTNASGLARISLIYSEMSIGVFAKKRRKGSKRVINRNDSAMHPSDAQNFQCVKYKLITNASSVLHRKKKRKTHLFGTLE